MDNEQLLVITGASRGIGRHIAKRALENGFKVLGVARHIPEDAGFPMQICDVTDYDAVHAVFKAIPNSSVYGIINAAGCASMNLHLTTPPNSMRKILECNLLGTMYCCAEGGKLLARKKSGRIINFSSIAVSYALQGESAYVAAKAGIEAFSRSFAHEMAPFNVTVNVIAPGPVDTALIGGVPEKKIESLRKRQILRRPLCVDDLWNVVSLLLDARSNTLSGEIFHLGGI